MTHKNFIGYYEVEKFLEYLKRSGKSEVYGALTVSDKPVGSRGVANRFYEIILQAIDGDNVNYVYIRAARSMIVIGAFPGKQDDEKQIKDSEQIWELITKALHSRGVVIIEASVSLPINIQLIEAWWGKLGFDKTKGYYLK